MIKQIKHLKNVMMIIEIRVVSIKEWQPRWVRGGYMKVRMTECESYIIQVMIHEIEGTGL